MAIEPYTLGVSVLPAECRPFRPLGAIANRAAPQVSPWLSAKSAATVLRAALAEEGLVVDGDGTPLGFVTLSRLDEAPEGADVDGRMTPAAVVLHESVPISVAASLMASLPTDHIAVVGDGRRAVGLLTSLDLARWIQGESRGTT